MDERRGDPAWAWWLAGLLAYLTLGRPNGDAPEHAPTKLAPNDLARWEPRDDPAEMTVRDLRRMPGIGDRRAAAAAEARWRHGASGGTLAWIDVPGIGEITAARVTAWLRDRGLSTELAPREPDP